MAGRRGPAPAPAAVKVAKGNAGKRTGDTKLRAQAAAEADLERAGAGFTDSAPQGSVGGGGGDIAAASSDAGAVSAITPPDFLNPDGLKVWNHLAPRLAAMRILQSIDGLAFGRYCNNFGRWVKMQRTMDASGETYTSQSPHGTYERAHPAFMIADRLDRQLSAAEANFALNPADRQRLFAARAAAGAGAGAGGADLFGPSSGAGEGAAPDKPAGADDAGGPLGWLN